MGVWFHAIGQFSVQCSNLPAGLDASHLHAHLAAFQFDENRAGIERLLKVGGQLFAQSFLELWLSGEVV